jgi:hypothetical protein
MYIYVLLVDPDTGDSNDVTTYAFSTEMGAVRSRDELIADGCESLLSIRPLRVSDNWVLDSKGGLKIATT